MGACSLLLVAAIVARVTGRLSRPDGPMLELNGVSYRYAGYATLVLHDIDLTLADGEIVGVVGANEAGKSTLCLVASGLAPASIGGALTGAGSRSTARRWPASRSTSSRRGSASASRTRPRSCPGSTGTVFEEVALGPMNLGLDVARDGRADAGGARDCSASRHLAERDRDALSGGQAPARR